MRRKLFRGRKRFGNKEKGQGEDTERFFIFQEYGLLRYLTETPVLHKRVLNLSKAPAGAVIGS